VFIDDGNGGTIDAPSLPDQIEASGRNVKAYFEKCPPRVRRPTGPRTPPITTRSCTTCRSCRMSTGAGHVVPLTDLASDLVAGSVPDFVWITPNLCSDMHDCPVARPGRMAERVSSSLAQYPGLLPAVVARAHAADVAAGQAGLSVGSL
jgi:hypothetical protein